MSEYGDEALRRMEYRELARQCDELYEENRALQAKCDEWAVLHVNVVNAHVEEINTLKAKLAELMDNLERCKGNELAARVDELQAKVRELDKATKLYKEVLRAPGNEAYLKLHDAQQRITEFTHENAELTSRIRQLEAAIEDEQL